MARLLTAELLLLALTAAFAAAGVPWLAGQPPAWPLLSVAFLMALAFSALYALANLAARRLRQPALLAAGLVALASVAVDALRRGPFAWGEGLALAAGLVLSALGGALGRGAGAGLWAYAAPLAAVRYALVPLAGSGEPVRALAVQSAAFYLFLRGLVRLAFPTSAEGNPSAGPLVHRPVPDRVVGLVEATARRRALPYATREDGSRDEEAVAVRCPRAKAAELAERLRAVLEGHPVTVTQGVQAGDEVELVIRVVPPPRDG
ncbi:hypothetical protein [Symbiobacterium thermophilum]|uniref:Uncharacterized protein n=1 Tax=Symbiobacterium thermophilum (strain DSM 24528 / JCM 14929 / IAM 14863 / T) TaxID=292459 RepID=Q67KC2_SYMTH|nr:hypothetical protein [Symbiobacterium thermophilum]BAD41876.1 hypothetical protein STH2893 [Symbiobacterium thermophilum IAM 14863]